MDCATCPQISNCLASKPDHSENNVTSSQRLGNLTQVQLGSLPVTDSKRHLGAGIAAVASYYVLARLALEWGGDLLPIPLWLATASVVGLALLLPQRYRWSVMIGGGIIGNLLSGLVTFDETLRSMLTPGFSVFVEVVFMTLTIGAVVGDGGALNRTRRSLKVVGLSMVGSALGASIAVLESASPVIGEQSAAWIRWALGDFVGLLIVVPLALSYRIPVITPRHPFVKYEAAAALLVVITSSIVVFNIDSPLTYLIVIAILWLGIRFGPRLAAPASLFIAVAGTYFSGQGAGPFVAHDTDAVLQVQGFNLAIALCSIVGSAHAVRAWNDQQQLAATLRALPDAIAVRNNDGSLQRSWIPPQMSGKVAELVELSSPSDNPLDLIRPGVGIRGRLTTSNGHSFERRVAAIGDGRRLELFRDMTEQDGRAQKEQLLRDELREARTKEQLRLGRLLHDGAIQELSVATLLIGLAKQAADPKQAERLTEAERRTAGAIGDLRTMANDLIPPSARGGALSSALAHYGRGVLGSSNISLTVTDTTQQKIVGDRAEALYLVGREALGNAAMHSGATEIAIILSDADGSAVLDIRDNGKGLVSGDKEPSDERHFGLQLMQDRIDEQQGSLVIETGSDGGVLVRASVPNQ